jgi:hypothetical protein
VPPAGDSTVRYERRGRVLVVRIEREAKRNAVDRVTAHGIDEALNLLDDDDELWAADRNRDKCPAERARSRRSGRNLLKM